jgi:hypothetical protein
MKKITTLFILCFALSTSAQNLGFKTVLELGDYNSKSYGVTYEKTLSAKRLISIETGLYLNFKNYKKFIGYNENNFASNNEEKFFGWIDDGGAKFDEIVSDAYIGIFPSLWKEADGLSPWRIMANGKPVITLSGNIFGEFLIKHIPELVFESSDDLNSLLIRLLDPAFYSQMQNRVISLYLQEYNSRFAINRDFYESFN